jgi:hypothetical protein
MTLAITMASDDVLGELCISISLVLAQARHLGPERSDFVHLPWSSEVIRRSSGGKCTGTLRARQSHV